MPGRRLTVAQADRALTLVRPIVAEVRDGYLDVCRELRTAHRFQALREISNDASVPHSVRERLAVLMGLIKELEHLGVQILEPELGLVAFDGVLDDGRRARLCWKLGEARIRTWFPPGGRYGERTPLPAPAAAPVARA